MFTNCLQSKNRGFEETLKPPTVGAPRRIRTSDIQIRSLTLYPAEPWALFDLHAAGLPRRGEITPRDAPGTTASGFPGNGRPFYPLCRICQQDSSFQNGRIVHVRRGEWVRKGINEGIPVHPAPD
jgi:hypothetical protein